MGLITRDSEVLDDLVYRTPNQPKKDGLDILIHYLPGAPKMEQTDWGSWIDMYVYEDVTLKAGERTYISQGFSAKLPDGYEAIMAPRSSTFKRWGILQSNGIGVIDPNFCNSDDIWMFPAYATRDITIPKGTRIAQFRIQEVQPKIYFQEVGSLNYPKRGGLGQSGA